MGTGVTIFIFLLFLKPRASQSEATPNAAASNASSFSRSSTITSSHLTDSSIQSTSASVATINTSTTTAVTTLTTTTIATPTGTTTMNSTTQNLLASVANMSTSIMVTVITSTTTATTKMNSPTTSKTRATTGITITKAQSTIRSNSTGASTIPKQENVTTTFPMTISNNGTYSSNETSLTKSTTLTTMTPTPIQVTAVQAGEEKPTKSTMSPLNTNPNGNASQTKIPASIPAITSTVSQVAPESTNRTTIFPATLSSKDEKKEKELGYDRDLVIIFGTMLSLMLVAGISYGICKCKRRRKNRQFMDGGGAIHITTSQL